MCYPQLGRLGPVVSWLFQLPTESPAYARAEDSQGCLQAAGHRGCMPLGRLGGPHRHRPLAPQLGKYLRACMARLATHS
jgi:hypothetical protein